VKVATVQVEYSLFERRGLFAKVLRLGVVADVAAEET
jgi:hypothetical protein